MGYKIIRRTWRPEKRRYTWGLVIAELAGIIALLVIFGISQPDLYRTKMWKVGFENGFNSNPNMILYAYANHRPLPAIPFVWSQTLTNFNVAISVLSLFLLLLKMILTILRVYFPLLGTFLAVVMTALYGASIGGQAGQDYADKRYPSSSAWYIRRSCDYASPYGWRSQCVIAKVSFALTVYMLFIYILNLVFGIYSMLPNKKLDLPPEDDIDEYMIRPAEGGTKANDAWEMQPRTPRMTGPFTPRTQAFQTLDRKLPLRASTAPQYA